MAVLLGFIGAKMILSPVLHIPAAVSLGAIVGIIAAAAGLSMLARRRAAARAEVSAAEPAPAAKDTEEVCA